MAYLHVSLEVPHNGLDDRGRFLSTWTVDHTVARKKTQRVRVLRHDVHSLEIVCHCLLVVRLVRLGTIDAVEAGSNCCEDIDPGFFKQLHSLTMSLGIIDLVS